MTSRTTRATRVVAAVGAWPTGSSTDQVRRVLAAVAEDASQEEVLAGLVDLAIAWTGARGAAVEIPALGPGATSWLWVHRGLAPDVAAGAGADGLTEVEVVLSDGPPGRLAVLARGVPAEVIDCLAVGTALAVEHTLARSRTLHRERWLNAVVDFSRLLAAPLPSRVALTALCEHARETVGAEIAWIMVRGPDDRFRLPALAGLDERQRTRLVGQDLSGTLSAEVIRSGRAHTLTGPDPDAPGEPSAMPLWRGPAVMLPAASSRGVECMLGLGWRPDGLGDVRALDLALRESLATIVALALRVARVEETAGHLSVMHQRDRIARDLHDRVIQRLYAIGLALSSVESLAPPATATRLDEVVTGLDDTILEIRRTITGLTWSPPVRG